MATLRLTYVKFCNHTIIPSLLAVESLCPETEKKSVHLLDDYLGNQNGLFATGGGRFSMSAKNVRLSSQGILSADLRTVAGTWKPATVAVRARCIHTTTSWMHELIVGDESELAPEKSIPSTFLELGNSCRKLRLKAGSLLKADCLTDHLTWITSVIDLDLLLGNANGSFSISGHKFSASARNVHLVNATLYAELRTISQEWRTDQIDLRLLVCNHGKGLKAANQHESLRVSKPPSIGLSIPDQSANHLYSPLDNDTDAFRLCYIEPGDWADPVRCDMITRRASHNDEYICLSYVWGDPEGPVTIYINSHPKPVTRNLYSAMRRLRQHGYFGAVWIDAICIDQTNVAEKTVQVTHMATTYAGARQVFVCLETADFSQEHTTMAYMAATFLNHLASDAHLQEAIKKTIASAKQWSRGPSELWENYSWIDLLVHSLQFFSSSPWFERTWTVQEYILSRDLVYAIGSEVLSTWTLSLALHRIMCHLRFCCKDSLRGFGGRSQGYLSASLWQLRRVLMLLDTTKSLSKFARGQWAKLTELITPYSAMDCALLLLQTCRTKKCSDPRDKLFAFTSVASKALGSFKVDYTKSVNDVYMEFTLGNLDHVGNFDIWCLAQPPSKSSGSRMSGLPSWVIDWTMIQGIEGQYYFYLQKDSMLAPPRPIRLPSKMYEQTAQGVLTVRGTRFDSVHAITAEAWDTVEQLHGQEILDAPQRIHEQEVVEPLEILNVQEEMIPPSQLKGWLHFLGIHGPAGKACLALLWDSFRGLMMAGQFRRLTNTNENTNSIPGLNPDFIWRAATQDDKDLFDVWAAIEQGQTADVTHVVVSLEELAAMRQLVDRIAGEKKLFKTQEGLIGLCPLWASTGDELFHISGSRWPVILRRRCNVDESPASIPYELIGTCYINGISEETVKDRLRQAVKIKIR